MYMKQNKNEDIIEILAHTKIGSTAQIGNAELRVKLVDSDSKTPCKGCVYNRRNDCALGTNFAQYACMGRYREDRLSVVFVRNK